MDDLIKHCRHQTSQTIVALMVYYLTLGEDIESDFCVLHEALSISRKIVEKNIKNNAEKLKSKKK